MRIEVGADTPYTDASGERWDTDAGFIGGHALDRGPVAIENTADDRLYQTERWGLSGYTISVPDGTYAVRLHFAETFTGVTGPGQRVFSVQVEDASINNLDVFAEAGGSNRALIKTVPVDVQDGEVNLSFTSSVQSPMINAIEILASADGTLLPGTAGGPVAPPSPTATPLPDPEPEPVIQPAAGQSLQAMVDAAPIGATVKVPAGTYRETIKVTKAITLDGQGAAVIDGEWTRPYWMVITADNVTVRGFTMRNAVTKTQDGGVRVRANAVTVRDNILTHTRDGAPVSLSGSNLKLLNNELAYGGQEGVHGTQISDSLIQGNRIHHNNTALIDHGWEAGGMKVTRATRVTWDGNDVHDNNGPGLWCDIDCRDLVVSNNRVHDNHPVVEASAAGIWFEISTGAKIFGNTVYRNSGYDVWGWGAGILIASSANAEIYDNLVAWNGDGIAIVSQNRSDAPAGNGTGNSVHDNTIIQHSGGTGLGWFLDWSGPMFSSGTNSGARNKYWFDGTEPAWGRFEWQGVKQTLADFNATPGEEAGRYLSTSERDQLLAAADLPTTP